MSYLSVTLSPLQTSLIVWSFILHHKDSQQCGMLPFKNVFLYYIYEDYNAWSQTYRDFLYLGLSSRVAFHDKPMET